MAQYDGSVRINTDITTEKAEKDIAKLKDRLEGLAAAQKALSQAGAEDTPLYREQARDIETLQKKIENLTKKKEELSEVTANQDDAKSLGAYSENAKALSQYLKDLEERGFYFGDEEYDKAYIRQKDLTDAVKEYKKELNKQTDIGSAQEAEKQAKALAKQEEVQRRIAEQAEKNLQKEADKIQKEAENEAKLQAQEAEKQAKLEAQIAEEQRLASIKENATISDQRMIDLLERKKQLTQSISDMEKAGMGYGYQEYDSAQEELANINAEMKDYGSDVDGISEKFSRLRTAAKKAFSAIASGAKKAFSAIISRAKQSNKSLNSNLTTILKYALGIRSLYTLFNKLKSAAKEGFQNLAQFSDTTNQNISALTSSLTLLKNSIAAAFNPILTVVTPILTSFIDLLSRAATYVGMFFSMLSGQSTFVKAKKVQEDYAASLNGTASAAKKAAGALAKFDDLDVLQKQDDSSGSGAGASAGDMFEEVSIPDQFKDIVQWLKEMWESSDFYELGAFLGEKIRDGLDSIDWNPIKETAQRIGKSLATLVNGFVEVDGLAESIGRTLGEAINTGLQFVNSFLDNTHWDSIGIFIGEGLNGIINTIEWEELGHFFAQKLNALFELVGSAAQEFDWSEFGNSLAESINTFISDFNWAESGANLGELIKGLLDTLLALLEKTDWQALGNGIAEFIGGIDWSGLAARLVEGIGAALGGIGSLIMGLLGDSIVEGALASYFVEKINEAGGNVVEGIFNGIIDGLKDIGQWIVDNIFTPFIDGFKAAFGINSPSTVMAEMGTYIVEGLINGILSLKDRAVDAIKNVGSNLLNGFLSLFGIHSPSTVMSENGMYLMAGLANGISENMNSVLDMFDMLGISVVEILAPMSESVITLFTEMTTVIVEQWTLLTDSTVLTWDSIADLINQSMALMNADILSGLSTAMNNWTSRWAQIVKKTQEACKEVISAVSAMNESVEAMCASMIAAINAVKSAASSLGSVGGGGSDSGAAASAASYSLDGIPQLASGSVIRGGNPFMAILGDQRRGQTNIEAPLDTIKQAVREELSDTGYMGGLNPTISLNVDGQEFARLTLGDILNEMRLQGYDVEVLGVS